MKYFIAPRSGEKSYSNFLSTIKHGVPMDRIAEFLSPEGKEILSKEEVIYAWGNREGRRGGWEKMQNGDVVIFYASKFLVMAGRVIFKQHSPDLALAMWPRDENGNPWEYTFFLNNLVYFKIPLEYFNYISGYKFKAVQGFQEITEPYISKILENKKDIEILFREFSDESSAEIPQETDSMFVNIPKEIHPHAFLGKFKQRFEKQLEKEKKKRSGFIDFDAKKQNPGKNWKYWRRDCGFL